MRSSRSRAVFMASARRAFSLSLSTSAVRCWFLFQSACAARRASAWRCSILLIRRSSHRACSLRALVAFALHPLAQGLAVAADGFGLLACPPLRRLFIGAAPLHFAKRAFALHLFLQHPER